jgi:hypothetical protein
MKGAPKVLASKFDETDRGTKTSERIVEKQRVRTGLIGDRLISLGTVKWRASVSFNGYGQMAGFSIFHRIRSNGGLQYLSPDTV